MVAKSEKITLRDGEEYDPVSHPSHYTKGNVECIVAIEAALTPDEFRGFCKGNALKYVWRELHKKGVEDLKKAMFYLEKLSKEEK
jgi:hypothetical protein